MWHRNEGAQPVQVVGALLSKKKKNKKEKEKNVREAELWCEDNKDCFYTENLRPPAHIIVQQGHSYNYWKACVYAFW